MNALVRLDGRSLTRAQLVAVARGASVELDAGALEAVARAAEFLAEQVRREEPIYGVSTGFGSNADKLLGAHPVRDAQVGCGVAGAVAARRIAEQPDRHARGLCRRAVRRGRRARDAVHPHQHAAARAFRHPRATLQALAAMLNAGVVPVVPQLGSVGASGDLAPLSHLAIVLLGGGEAFFAGERMPGARSAASAPALQPVTLSLQGRPGAQQRHRADARDRRAGAATSSMTLLDTADLAAAMTIDAFAGRLGAFARRSACVASASGPGPASPPTCARCWRVRPWPTSPTTSCRGSGSGCRQLDATPATAAAALRHRLGLGAARPAPRPREVLPALPPVPRRQETPAAGQLFAALHAAGARRGARCVGAGRARARHRTQLRSPTIRWCSRTRRPQHVEQQVISAGHFHGMPLALAMSYVKAAIPVLASISERRLNKLVDPATNDGLPAVPDRQRGRHRIGPHDRAVHRRGDRQRPRQPRDAGVGVLDPDQRQRRGPRLDGRQRSAPRAGDGRRPRQGARAGALHRGAGARPAVGHDQCGAQARQRHGREGLRGQDAGGSAHDASDRDAFLAEVDGLRRELAEGAPVHAGCGRGRRARCDSSIDSVPGPRPRARRGSRRDGAPGG